MSTPANDQTGLPDFTEYAAGSKVEATYHGADDDARAEADGLLALIREHHRVEVEMGQPGSPAVLLGHVGDLLRIIDTPAPPVPDVDAIARAVTDLADELDGWQTRPADLVERLRDIALLRGEPRGD